ncbi:MAG: RNA pyrophosphohydrolase [Alphaproteobacteria bacterium]|nr:RNA pyrophosphohydrolase [Alphaproteobacteria bacterium]
MAIENYRQGIGIFLLRHGTLRTVFSAERINEPDAWQIPQGGVNPGEDDYDAAIRELREETGISSVKFLRSTKDRYNYIFPEEIRKKVARHNWAKYIGQSMKFFLFEFIGDESEINLNFSDEVEFSHWKWASIDTVIEQMIDFKRAAVIAAAKELF